MSLATVVDEPKQEIEQHRSASPWVRRGGPAVLAAALLLYVVIYVRWPSFLMQVDAQVYRFGAQRVVNGLDLYSTGLTGNHSELLFVYTPFAALCFLPLLLVNNVALEILSLVSTGVLLAYSMRRMVKSFGLEAATGLWSLAALLVGVSVWLEPVRLSIQLGQINIAILAVVVFDLLGSKQRRWAGIGIGLVAGIKLTPAIFIVYLAIIGRLRAALVAAATFATTVIVGFAVLPKDSRRYWLTHDFEDVARISHDPHANTSLRGLFLRLHYPAALATVAVILLAVAALVIAAIAYRRGHAVLAIAVVGMASTVASPFSWSHHWVWLVPLLVHLGYQAYVCDSRYSAWAMWMFWAVFASWFTSFGGGSPDTGVLSLRVGGIWRELLPGVYVLGFVAVLVYTAAWLRWSAAKTAPNEPELVQLR